MPNAPGRAFDDACDALKSDEQAGAAIRDERVIMRPFFKYL